MAAGRSDPELLDDPGAAFAHSLQSARRREVDLKELLRCPACTNEKLVSAPDRILCGSCNRAYPLSNGVPVMQVSAASVVS